MLWTRVLISLSSSISADESIGRVREEDGVVLGVLVRSESEEAFHKDATLPVHQDDEEEREAAHQIMLAPPPPPTMYEV